MSLTFASSIANQLDRNGYIAYLAGGCVRDFLLKKEPKDYDLATSATPEQVLELYPHGNAVGAHFGVIIVSKNHHHVEIATFRTDGSYLDGRRPNQVTFSTPEEDAQRRDFTINGMFQDTKTNEIIDFVGGRSDLTAKIIRAIGNPQARFQEDALRLLRAIRLACRLDFQIEAETWQAICNQASLLQQISPERIRDEVSQILTHGSRRRGVEMLVQSGLMAFIIPEFLSTIGCEQPPEWHPEGDVYTHTCIMLDLLGKESVPIALALAVLLHDIGKPATQTFDVEAKRIRFNGHDAVGAEMAHSILKRLRFPNQIMDDTVHMVARHMQFMNVQLMRTAKLKRFMSSEVFEQELELHRVDCASSNGFTDNYEFLLAKKEAFAHEPLIPPPLITGKDLIARQLQPGPEFKSILEQIQTEQLEGRIQTRDQAFIFLDQLLVAKVM